MTSLAIIGLGPWGLCALEQVITRARVSGVTSELTVHLIEPGTPGAGVYDLGQPDYLLLNNPAGQLSLYTGGDHHRHPYAMGLHDWAVAQGYRWVGDRCEIGRGGRSPAVDDFLPRRLMGEYLNWFYRQLLRAAPDGLAVVHHATEAVDVLPAVNGELVVLADGAALEVEQVILTSGHTPNRPQPADQSMPPQLPAYPVTRYTEGLPAARTVAISGLGLVGIDAVIALTVGRGGRFEGDGLDLIYRASGREPQIRMFSRSGLPFTAKSISGSDLSGVYEPAICTESRLASLREQALAEGGIDFRATLLPLLFAEMSVRYYEQCAARDGGRGARDVRTALVRAWSDSRFEQELEALAARFGPFDPGRLFFGPRRPYADSQDYERSVVELLDLDLREAMVPGGASPIKSAAEVLRIFRDAIRGVIDHRGLTLASHLDFYSELGSRVTRLIAGPPALRSAQLLALNRAGLLSFPYGPAPALGQGTGSRTRIESTRLRAAHSEEVDAVIRGHLDGPRIADSASVLLTRLHAGKRIGQLRYGTTPVGSIELTADAHPVAADGTPQERLWVFGVLTEGVRYFNHYIPSPSSRIRAVQDIGRCVDEILNLTGVVS